MNKQRIKIAFSVLLAIYGCGSGTQESPGARDGGVDVSAPVDVSTPVASLTIEPAIFDFGETGDAFAPTQQFTVRWAGTAMTPASGLVKISTDMPFSIASNGCADRELDAANPTCTFSVQLNVPGTGLFVSPLVVRGKAGSSARSWLQGHHQWNPAEGLIGYWKFDGEQGSVVADSSGNGNHGEIYEGHEFKLRTTHATPAFVSGRFGKGLSLDGIDDFVDVPHSRSLQRISTNNAVSISAWVYLDHMQYQAAVLGKHGEADRQYPAFQLSLSGGASLGEISVFTYAQSQSPVPLSRWTHIGMTCDGIQINLYMNGELTTSADVGWPVEFLDSPLIFGAQLQGELREFLAGAIDEVQLYDRALSPAEMARLAIFERP